MPRPVSFEELKAEEKTTTGGRCCTECQGNDGYTPQRCCDDVAGISRGPHVQATD